MKFKPIKYVKDNSFDPIYNPINKKFAFRLIFYPYIFISLGLIIFVSQFLVPLIYFKTKDTVTKPVSSSILGIASGFGDFQFNELGGEEVKTNTNVPKYFYLTIPKLKITNAVVETNPAILKPDEALGHYPGSPMPGENGNAFIYGHSVLPIFYNPKNYKTIFSTLYKLETGDKFTINYNNQTLTYVVESKVILKPKDVNPLSSIKPKYLNESTVTLMTCDPPGTKINRLLVNAVLEK